MRATVQLRLPDGRTATLGHGDLIGRLWSAALCLDDARVSEAHGMVSLRGDTLHLLALRGVFVVDGQRVPEVVLSEGQEILVAPDLALHVERVVLPDAVLALEGDGLARQVLHARASLHVAPRPRLQAGYDRRADVHVWTNGAEWRAQVRGAAPVTLTVGTPIAVGERVFRAVSVDLRTASQDATRIDGSLQAPLTLIALYDSVVIHRGDARVCSLSGRAARLVSELAAVGGPIGWEALAREVWRGEEDRVVLRRRLDVTLARLRQRLKDHRVRDDLVRPDGAGQFQLNLHPGDRVDDRT